MSIKHPASKVVLRILPDSKMPVLNNPIKSALCDTIITPSSLYRRNHPTNHELWLRLHAESIQRLLEGKKQS